jgi:glutamyl-tRNA reductase
MLILVGCNHRSAPVAFRERLAFRSEELPAALERLRDRDGIDEAMILSTCNRVEVLVRGDHSPRQGVETIKRFLCEERGLDADQVDRHVYHFASLDAVRHLFSVAAGLDSMILGEPQILGQVKQAYLTAKSAEATGTVLERLLQNCLRAAKRIRAETGISRNAVSVAYAAANLARQIFGDLQGKRVLLIGSGKMIRLVARHLVANGVSDVAVTSRTYNHAVRLALECSGRAVHWEDGLGRLSEVDIVVSCTASPRTILGRKEVAAARRMRRGESLFIIDIAVPRDVDPEVNQLDNVYLYDIDGLQSIVDANVKERERAAEHARQGVEQEVEGFDRWRQSLEITPTIVALRETLLRTARREVERFRGRLGPLSPEQQLAVEEMARGLVQKILHRPITHLRKSVERGDVDASTALYREIFGMEEARRSDPGRSRRKEDDRASDDRSAGAGPRRLLKGGKDS